MDTPREFHYRTRLGARSFTPGAHASRVAGGGIDVAALVPLDRARDARRLDLRASLRDPFGHWWAREQRQRSALPVVLMLDRSASLAAGSPAREQAARDFASALAYSATRHGDAFGVIGFDTRVQALRRPLRSRAAALAAVEALGAFDGNGAQGVLEAAALLPRQSTLVFLLSDFCWPAALLDAALAPLQHHDVVPVWLDDAQDALAGLPRHGLLPLADAETRQRRLVWWRPALRRRWLEQQAAQRAAVHECLARHQRQPFVLGSVFDADAVSGWFAAR